MKVQKEIENVTRVPNRYPTEPLTMEDAVIFHRNVVDRAEKARKELNKELGLGDIEEEGFTGRTDKKFSTPELKKMKLSESLFESFDDYAYSNDSSGKYISGEMSDEEYNSLWDKYELERELEREDYHVNEELEETDGWPRGVFEALQAELEDLYNLNYELESAYRGAYTDCNDVEELADYVDKLADKLSYDAELLRHNAHFLDESLNEGSENLSKEHLKDLLKEKDWYKYGQDILNSGGDIGSALTKDGYSKDEQDVVTKYLDEIDSDENRKALHDRKYQQEKAEEEEKARKEEQQQAEQKKKEAQEKRKQALKKLPGEINSTLRGAGINI